MVAVCVTGCSGLLGPALVDALLQGGHTVHALVHNTSLHTDHHNLHKHSVDINDPHALHATLSNLNLHTVVHMAALMDFYPKNPDAVYRTNVEGTR